MTEQTYCVELTEAEVKSLHDFTHRATEMHINANLSVYSTEVIETIKTIASMKVKMDKIINIINDDAN